MRRPQSRAGVFPQYPNRVPVSVSGSFNFADENLSISLTGGIPSLVATNVGLVLSGKAYRIIIIISNSSVISILRSFKYFADENVETESITLKFDGNLYIRMIERSNLSDSNFQKLPSFLFNLS